MIDNPLPDQVMQEMDAIQKAADFEDYCKNHAIEIAKDFKVHPDLVDDFLEWYHDYMCQNHDPFDPDIIMLDDDYIKDWWKDNGEYFDDFNSPYIDKIRLDPDLEPTDQELMSSFGTKWHDAL